MKIGVVSDTHNNLKNVRTIISLFNEQALDLVVHTGDITQAKTLELFSELRVPLYGVFGNNDVDERDSLQSVIERHGFHFCDPPLEVCWADRQIIIVHDPLEFDGHLRDDHDLALHGHTHRYRLEHEDSLLFFNPGECAGHMRGYNAIGVVDLGSLSAEVLKF